jgi:hypothetical protein
MSVDLFCFSAFDSEQTQKILTEFELLQSELIASNFNLYPSSKTNKLDMEIALDYGLIAKSKFMISLVNKLAADKVQVIAKLVRSAFGHSNIILMMNGDLYAS